MAYTHDSESCASAYEFKSRRSHHMRLLYKGSTAASQAAGVSSILISRSKKNDKEEVDESAVLFQPTM